jgi:hypothetical protein
MLLSIMQGCRRKFQMQILSNIVNIVSYFIADNFCHFVLNFWRRFVCLFWEYILKTCNVCEISWSMIENAYIFWNLFFWNFKTTFWWINNKITIFVYYLYQIVWRPFSDSYLLSCFFHIIVSLNSVVYSRLLVRNSSSPLGSLFVR